MSIIPFGYLQPIANALVAFGGVVVNDKREKHTTFNITVGESELDEKPKEYRLSDGSLIKVHGKFVPPSIPPISTKNRVPQENFEQPNDTLSYQEISFSDTYDYWPDAPSNTYSYVPPQDTSSLWDDDFNSVDLSFWPHR